MVNEQAYFRTIKNHLSSCIFSDILTDMNIDSVLAGFTLNISSKKIMGRANTLKIRSLQEGEDFRGIYDALKTYESVKEGEIIVVENECPNYAYFGELNANLSIRSGAVATIVGGVTRDYAAVKELDYPVFSKGYCCKDVRGRATFESQNQRITINGIDINAGDLIFGDVDGIVVIPQYAEKEILEKAIRAASVEKSVLSRIIGNENGFEIYKKEGAF